jgi:cytochrome P450
LFAESQSIIGAGTETVSNSLSTLSYHILANPHILLQLQKEINEAATKARLKKRTDIIGKDVLVGLPFLAACIKEGLRIAGPPAGRLPRINSKAAMVYTSPENHTYTLPQGTPMSMCITDIHFNSTIFEDPYEFKPQRWLGASMGPPTVKKRMEHFYSPFGKGSRNCVGSELAKIQILLATGNMFWKFDMDLFETGDRDVKVVRDCFAGFAEVESRGIRVVLRKAE